MKSTSINSNATQDAIIPAIVIPGLTRNPDALLDWIPAFAGMTTLGFAILPPQYFSDALMMDRSRLSAPPQAPGVNRMRDLLLTAIVFGALPFVLKRPWIGVLLWSWMAT
jgi:hypothetical protein